MSAAAEEEFEPVYCIMRRHKAEAAENEVVCYFTARNKYVAAKFWRACSLSLHALKGSEIRRAKTKHKSGSGFIHPKKRPLACKFVK